MTGVCALFWYSHNHSPETVHPTRAPYTYTTHRHSILYEALRLQATPKCFIISLVMLQVRTQQTSGWSRMGHGLPVNEPPVTGPCACSPIRLYLGSRSQQCKAKRQYLLTLQVSRCCLLALQSGVVVAQAGPTTCGISPICSPPAQSSARIRGKSPPPHPLQSQELCLAKAYGGNCLLIK